MTKTFIITGAIAGVIAVILGAFASHILKPVMPEPQLMSFNTGVRYQMYHAILLLVIAALMAHLNPGIVKVIYYLLLAGMICFSGSIYGLTLGPIFNLPLKFLGPVTPLGGLMLIISWILLAVAAWKN